MTDLWCIHILGPDDVFPAPNRQEAEAKAKELNAFLGRFQPVNDDVEHPPKVLVTVERWPHSAQLHEDGLSEWVPAA